MKEYGYGNWLHEPCGGGVEHLHRGPASRRRRRNRKSQNWDSKIWLRVPRDSDPIKIALTRTSSIYKRQTRPLVREGAPQKPDRNCQTVINIWSWAPVGTRHQDFVIDRPSVYCNFDCDFELTSLEFRSSKETAVWPEEELENLECDITCAIITVILSVKELIVFTSCEDPINRFTNPNVSLSHGYTWQYIYWLLDNIHHSASYAKTKYIGNKKGSCRLNRTPLTGNTRNLPRCVSGRPSDLLTQLEHLSLLDFHHCSRSQKLTAPSSLDYSHVLMSGLHRCLI
jgi:hypothetical protein